MDRCFPSTPLASPRSWRTYSRTEFTSMDILVDSRIMEVPELRGRQHTVRRRRQEAVVRLLGGVLYREHTTLVLPKPRAFIFIQFCHSMAILGLAKSMFLTLAFPFLPNIARILNNASSAMFNTEQHRHGILLSCRNYFALVGCCCIYLCFAGH